MEFLSVMEIPIMCLVLFTAFILPGIKDEQCRRRPLFTLCSAQLDKWPE